LTFVYNRQISKAKKIFKFHYEISISSCWGEIIIACKKQTDWTKSKLTICANARTCARISSFPSNIFWG
jgi:hypothetical protein